MSSPDPTPSEGSARQIGSRIASSQGGDAKLQAALIAAGFDDDKAATAIAVMRTALTEEGSGASPDHPEAKQAGGGGHSRTLADVTPHLIWHSASGGCWIWAAPNWHAYTGQDRDESKGHGWLDAIHPDDREATMQAWHKAPVQGSFDVAHRIRRAFDGAWRMHHTHAAALPHRPGQDQQGPPAVTWVGASTDVEDLLRLEAERHALLLELRHRTRNLLTVVQAIAYQSLTPTTGRSDFIMRLAALGRVQGFLSRNVAWSVPLRELVEAELRAFADGHSEKVQVEGPEVDLPGEVVQPLALALHELASNAAKHGAVVQPSGQLTVSWRLEGGAGMARLVIEWRESGVVMPANPLPRRFGCQIIERMVPYQLRGEAKLEPGKDGIRCRLALPFPQGSGSQTYSWTGSSRARGTDA